MTSIQLLQKVNIFCGSGRTCFFTSPALFGAYLGRWLSLGAQFSLIRRGVSRWKIWIPIRRLKHAYLSPWDQNKLVTTPPGLQKSFYAEMRSYLIFQRKILFLIKTYNTSMDVHITPQLMEILKEDWRRNKFFFHPSHFT